MDTDTRDQFRLLREDIARLRDKIDAHIALLGERCARRGEELAVLAARDGERNRRVDRRIAFGLLLVATLSFLMRYLP